MPIVMIVVTVVSLVVMAHVAPFPFILDAITGDLSIWRVPQTAGQRTIYLTFDDGPNPTVTPELLDLLKEKKVPATFFLIDEYVSESTAPIIQRMFAEGHAVAQHSGDRWQMSHSPKQLAAELQAAADHMERLTGLRPCPIFRPHGGWRSIAMFKGLSLAHYKLAGWSWLSWDWVWFRKRTPERISNQVLANAAPGKIIVLHDGHHRDPRADRRYTLEAAKRIIEGLQRQGYTFGALC